ncbi:NAD-dependent epimerase/dehydratase family protein [Fulvivirga sp. RKSG066]|uniref:saccharopine dehydrogenase family protein n=1 Tax=Fulvivirga aurantia TaxID=2529383 RepID=UPI0012BBD07E|nr:saccharopine dehydrogenase NADP-binding domain-containing protein [Fulvivirga aurantia]MTI23240.1 NAD-dependent epimerase/dehydratase family protein [Fulvivirga aurantia]
MILVYGAYGYTGKLIVDEALQKNLSITIAGRDKKKTETLAKEAQVPFISFDLEDVQLIINTLQEFDLVIHCAGPFEYTASIMAEACIQSKTHYIDITGEYQVFENLHLMHEQAAEAGIMLLPGAGFDVVPSDCLAAQLQHEYLMGDKLELAFTSTGASLSRGTAKTMVENIHKGQLYREEGVLKSRKLGKSTRNIDYGAFNQISVGISWGDICTAHYSTGIPNIEVFTGSTEKQISQMKWANYLKSVLSWRWVKNIFLKKIDKKPAGPSEEKRTKANMYLWGKISGLNDSHEKRIKTPNGYTLTARSAVLIAQKILNGDFKKGYQTPSSAYGKDLIFEIDGCEEIK